MPKKIKRKKAASESIQELRSQEPVPMPMALPAPTLEEEGVWKKIQRWLLGRPKDLRDRRLFQHVSLIPVLAWVGMGADGLSSSAYGPEESFKVLQNHLYLVPGVVLATVLTIVIISMAYSRVIEHFPHGGGGYTVASHLLGPLAGLFSGCALTVDYMLTITVSIAAGGDAFFSNLPPHWQQHKMAAEIAALGLLILLNLRGVKESVLAVLPIFLLFVASHLVLVFFSLSLHWREMPQVAATVSQGWQAGLASAGGGALFVLFLRAYSMGAGTYTGIEAVSNGLAILREPHVASGKRTMLYMASSLVLASGGLFLGYLIVGVRPVEGLTLNAVLARQVFGHSFFGPAWQGGLVLATLLSEAGLLLIAAQTGFIDGPRVMANMAVDSWVPKRFSSLSERFTMQNGVLLFGLASLLALLYTGGNTSTLVLMYSINVFITFSLTQLSMTWLFWRRRRQGKPWLRPIAIHVLGFLLCFSILVVMIFEKFMAGGWLTLLATSGLVGFCLLIHRHYQKVRQKVRNLDQELENLMIRHQPVADPVDPRKPTAVLLVESYGGAGIHSLFSIFNRYYPGHFKNAVFISVAVLSSGNFKGEEDLGRLQAKIQKDLEQYVDLCRRMGVPAKYELTVGTEVVDPATDLCRRLKSEFPTSVFFASKLIFEKEHWYQRWLHNHTAYAIQRRLEWEGIPMTVLPVRILS